MYRLYRVSERLCGPGSPRGMRAVSGSCHGGASKMAPDLRMVSDPAEVWRRTNSSGKRFQVPEFDAICRGPRVDASRESSDVMGPCALSAIGYGRGMNAATSDRHGCF